MDLHFLGVGEACDGSQSNTSILLGNSNDNAAGRILFDCGFSVPHRYLSLNPSPEELEIIWISHFHGDHFFGTPLLLLWFWENGRRRPLHILGPPGIEVKVMKALELAYPKLSARLKYALIFIELEAGERQNIADMIWQTAYNMHAQPCLSVRLEAPGNTIFYSGDGRPTQMTLSLATGCDLIIHEAYDIKDTTPGHGSIESCLDFASKAGAKRLALVHLQRSVRLRSGHIITGLRKNYPGMTILLPDEGSILTI